MHVQEYLRNIKQDRISVIASGTSIEQMTNGDIERIRNSSFQITLNYAPCKMQGHLNLWSDVVVSEFLYDYFLVQGHPRVTELATRDSAFTRDSKVNFLKEHISAWFDKHKDGLQGNYTIVWLLQMLQKYIPQKEIFIFGLDMKVDGLGPDHYKWYDVHTKKDFNHRGKGFPAIQKLQECSGQLDSYISPDRVWNCNPDSGYKRFAFCDWKTRL